MAKISDHTSASVKKILLMGDSGSGKTASILSLIKAGYSTRFLDFDNGLDYLFNRIKLECPEKADDNYFVTLRDRFTMVNGKVYLAEKPRAAQTALSLLTHWKTPTEDLGPITTWTPKDILVLDSLTMFSKALKDQVEFTNGHHITGATLPDWGLAMNYIERTLQLLTSTDVPCSVIVIAHVDYMESVEGAIIKGFPTTIGKKLSPKIPTYFNNVFKVVRTGHLDKEVRTIFTRSHRQTELKAAAVNIPTQLPVDTGLAEFFKH